jgi:hypothetical protein
LIDSRPIFKSEKTVTKIVVQKHTCETNKKFRVLFKIIKQKQIFLCFPFLFLIWVGYFFVITKLYCCLLFPSLLQIIFFQQFVIIKLVLPSLLFWFKCLKLGDSWYMRIIFCLYNCMRDLPTHQCCYNGIVVKQILNSSCHFLYPHFWSVHFDFWN